MKTRYCVECKSDNVTSIKGDFFRVECLTCGHVALPLGNLEKKPQDDLGKGFGPIDTPPSRRYNFIEDECKSTKGKFCPVCKGGNLRPYDGRKFECGDCETIALPLTTRKGRKLPPIDYKLVVTLSMEHEPSEQDDAPTRHYEQLVALLEDLMFCGEYGALRIVKVDKVKEDDKDLCPYG